MNKLQILIIIAGLFQIISQGLDQYVIQKENAIRTLENQITQHNDTLEENVNGNITYGTTYSIILRDAFHKLHLKNDEINYEFLLNSLKVDKKIAYDHFQLLITNPYIEIEDPEEYLKYFNQIEIMLNDKNDVRLIRNELYHDFRYTGFILNYLYEKNQKLEVVIKDLDIELRNVIKFKYLILILAMICNIISIFFVMLFFLNIFGTKKYKKFKISFFKN